MKKIISVIGARPQFIKHAPVQLELQQHFHSITVHTGQHYDENMSAVFFNELGIPKPDYLFNIGGSKPQAAQTGIMMTEIEKVCLAENPDAMLIYGDTNSTLAGTLVAAKLQIPIIHIEAGLRSFNRMMPEEINRIVADEFATLLFCPTKQAVENLKKEGIVHDKIFVCGDVMCDMLELIRPKAKQLIDYPYYFATIHRPYNTDDEQQLKKILNALNNLDKKVVFAIHPRTISRMQSFGLQQAQFNNIQFVDPVGYIDSISYQLFSDGIITDSGGMQKEAYMLQKKCITLRSETEWIETLANGWNTLMFISLQLMQEKLSGPAGAYSGNIYGNGNAAHEIVSIIKQYI
ncbi:MAG: UDP-N-acetylglucosamine 2-epimerase (non-hydrolyzing) [Ferruginibacter sp.]